MVTAADRGAFLQDLFWKSQEQEVSLFSLLKGALQAHIAQSSGTASGNRQLITASGNGRTSAFAIPDFYKFMTSDEYRQMFDGFVQSYKAAIKTLGITTPAEDDSSKDQQIYDVMDADVRTRADTVHMDYLLLGFPYGGGAPTQ